MLKLNKKTRIGSYTLIMSAIVLAVLIIINIVALNMPSKLTKLDMTELELYTLSEKTLEAVPKIDEDVTIYFICQNGDDMSGSAIDNMPTLSVFLQRYEELNEHIKVKWIDPIEEPQFAEKYTEDSIENYSLIVESAKRFKTVDFAGLYYYFSDTYGKIPAEQYQNFMTQAYYYTGSYPALTLNFDGESQITAALDYVTASYVPTVYALSGHGETAMSTSLTSRIEENSIEYESLMLLNTEIPEDAEYIIINAPTNDISAEEAAKLSAYLGGGGNIFLTTDSRYTDMPNLMGVMKAHGLEAISGSIYEGDASHYYYQQNLLIPNVSTESSLTSALAASYPLLLPNAHGIAVSESENINATPLFTTSPSAYIQGSENAVQTFNIAVHTEDSASGANIIWCASPAFSDQWNGYTGGATYGYYLSMLSGTMERDRISNDILANEIESAYLIVSESAANFWSIIFIAIIPLAFAVIGIIYWYRRRSR